MTIPRDGLQGISYDTATNRISNTGWTYDAAGNQTRALIPGSSTNFQRYQYDAANRLAKVKNDSGTTIAIYTYGDSNDRLIAQDGDENSNYRTYYAGEDGSVCAEFNETPSSPTSPQRSKSYVYLEARLLSTLTPNGSGGEAFEYHHPDRLGTRIITNPATGGTSAEQSTLPFGTALGAESSGTPSKRRFTSYDRSDTTQLDYAVNRHYDSSQGRFTQVDPIQMQAVDLSDPQSLNLYAYCGNDPINNVDPSGLGFISFLKHVFRTIGKILTNKWVLLVVGVLVGGAAALAFIWGFVTAGIILAATSAALVLAAFHPIIQKVAFIAGSIASGIQGLLGVLNAPVLGTPPWNPESGIGPVSNFLGRGGRRRRSRGIVRIALPYDKSPFTSKSGMDRPCRPEVRGVMNKIAKAFGGKVDKDNQIKLPTASISYDKMEETMKRLGFTEFTNESPRDHVPTYAFGKGATTGKEMWVVTGIISTFPEPVTSVIRSR